MLLAVFMVMFLGVLIVFGNFLGTFWETKIGGKTMRKKGYKGRCEKRILSKCIGVCKTYDAIQYAYADILQSEKTVKEFHCNVLLDDLSEGEYTTDFVCIKTNGDLMVRECIQRKYLTKPMTVKILDASRVYWLKRGANWGLVIDEEK